MFIAKDFIMFGVKEDIEKFIYLFSEKRDFEFNQFIDVWQTLHFGLIYCGRKVSETRYLIEEMFIIIKSFLSIDYSKKERVCAVYLLYSIFVLQPLRNKVYIRIERNEFQDLWYFVNDNIKGCIDLGFCFFRLFTDHAFDFVYNTELHTVETATRRVSKAYIRKNFDLESKNVKRFSENLLKQIGLDQNVWRNYEKEYNSLKLNITNMSLTDTSSFSTRQFVEAFLKHPKSVPEVLEKVKAKVKVKKSEGGKKSRLLENAIRDDSLGITPVESVEQLSTFSMPAIEESSTIDTRLKTVNLVQ